MVNVVLRTTLQIQHCYSYVFNNTFWTSQTTWTHYLTAKLYYVYTRVKHQSINLNYIPSGSPSQPCQIHMVVPNCPISGLWFPSAYVVTSQVRSLNSIAVNVVCLSQLFIKLKTTNIWVRLWNLTPLSTSYQLHGGGHIYTT